MLNFNISIGLSHLFIDEITLSYLFLPNFSSSNLDEDELITVKKIKFRKLLNMINNGKIYGSYTICAVMIYAARKKLI